LSASAASPVLLFGLLDLCYAGVKALGVATHSPYTAWEDLWMFVLWFAFGAVILVFAPSIVRLAYRRGPDSPT